jgi:hypothetical protein
MVEHDVNEPENTNGSLVVPIEMEGPDRIPNVGQKLVPVPSIATTSSRPLFKSTME